MKLPLCMMGTSPPPSPPSRGAWIEMSMVPFLMASKSMSPPSRGAWIEIFCLAIFSSRVLVAPLAGGVD